MFLEPLCRRNPQFILSVFHLHRRGELKPNTYVIDLDTFIENFKHIKAEADNLNLTIYPMTKQIGRNPVILDLLKQMHCGKVVAVDWMGALQIVASGGEIGHVGHLVQVPKTVVNTIAGLNPDVWTVFSYEKAREINDALANTNRTQNLLIRVWKEGDTFYPGHEGGISLDQLVENAVRINSLPHVRIVGVTSFPCMLYDVNKKMLYPTQNTDTIVEASKLLMKQGFQIEQVNAPGTTSTVSLDLLAQKGVTHVEPGHGMTGTTPAHAFDDLPEKPAILYLSEVSHSYKRHAYFYGGGLYIDPVFNHYPVRALLGRNANSILKDRFEALLPDPNSIDYYGTIKSESSEAKSGDTVILGFRAQAFHTRARISVIKKTESGFPKVIGMWDATGRSIA
jgi:predicted amino acid racemase